MTFDEWVQDQYFRSNSNSTKAARAAWEYQKEKYEEIIEDIKQDQD